MIHLLLILGLLIDPTKIGKVNSAKSEAKQAYEKGDFKKAAALYKMLSDSLGVTEEEVKMNMAHAYFQSNDTTQARNTYQSLTQSTNRDLKSIAHQQLGVMANREGQFEPALAEFKSALKANPNNEEARYNYELVKKKLEEQKKQQQQENKDQQKDQKDQNDQKENKDKKENKENKDEKKKDQEQKDKKDQQQKDQKDKEQKDKEQKDKDQKQKEEQEKKEENDKDKEKKDTPPNVSEKLKDMKISEEKAKMVLEAMKNQEVQYLQQNKRKATKPRSKGKPDW